MPEKKVSGSRGKRVRKSSRLESKSDEVESAKKPKLNGVKSKNEDKNENVVSTHSFRKKVKPPCNIFQYFKNYQMGLPCERYKKSLKNSVINYCKTFQLYKVECPFDRRVTFLVWHPTNPRLLSVTSHGGDIILYNYEQDLSSSCMIKGIGAGGSVQGMKFDPQNPEQIYTVSMEGKFLVLNFHTKEARQFLETNDINRWYVSLDVNSNNNVMVAGDTKGGLTVLTVAGEIIDKVQMHKKGNKVSHAEFSKREPWLLCTSSTDCTIKLWDIRKLKTDSSGLMTPIQVITHKKPFNAAYFSLTDGCRLLTTDQFDKIFIYRAPLWNLETCINHPHRQFQHLTPIKAYWHPLEDIVLVGRYPHKDFPGYHPDELRTIDFFDADNGQLLYQHYQTGFNGILSLNRFNIVGDALASSYGTRFLIWKPNFKDLERMSKKQDQMERRETPKQEPEETCDIDWTAVLKKQPGKKKEGKKLNKKNPEGG